MLAWLVSPVVAHAGTGLTIQPVKVSENIEPNQTLTGNILLTNDSDGDVNIEINTQDFVPLAGTDTLQFVNSAPGVTSVKDWITVNNGVKSFVFKQGAQMNIPYSITAPKDVEPGSHFGVIFFKATAMTSGGSLSVGTQVGVLVLMTVPGNFLQKGTITDFTAPSFIQHGPVQFSMNFQNTGTVYFEPKGDIVISNMFGKKVGDVSIGGEVVLPTGVKDLSYVWNTNSLLLGKYTAVATIFDGSGNKITSTMVSFYAFPVWYFVILIIILIVLFLLFKLFKSKVNINISLK